MENNCRFRKTSSNVRENFKKILLFLIFLYYSEFRELFSIIATEAPKKFDRNAANKGVGGFFFLRYICPAITSPHVYGLLAEPLNQSSQRYAVLLSKVLQNISNGKFFPPKFSKLRNFHEISFRV